METKKVNGKWEVEYDIQHYIKFENKNIVVCFSTNFDTNHNFQGLNSRLVIRDSWVKVKVSRTNCF